MGGGSTKQEGGSFGVVFTSYLEVLAILKGGGAQKVVFFVVLAILKGGAQKDSTL